MRLSSFILSTTSLMVFSALANPTGGESEMENIEKRGCNTGNWCCTESYPSAYCAKYCAAGSIYIDCSGSNVSICCLREGSRQVSRIMINVNALDSARPTASASAIAVTRRMMSYSTAIHGARGRYIWDLKGLVLKYS